MAPSVPLLDLRAQHALIGDEVADAIAAVVDSQQFVLGPQVEMLEAEFARSTGSAYAIACASGTDALLLSLDAFSLAPGDEVIVPAFTFFASAGAIWNAGLRPVFADVDGDTFNMGAAQAAPLLTDRTRAIMPVHLFGQMAPMAGLQALAAAHDLRIVEDAAQSIGARQRIDDRAHVAGSLGDTAAFSFFPTKNVGAFGDGGMITTSSADLADRIAKLRVHGGRQMYHHEYVGTNSRLDALQAAVLRVKLRHLDRWTSRRRENAAFYRERLDGLTDVRLPRTDDGNDHVYNQFTIRARQRDALKVHLDACGVGSGVYYPVPLHLQPCFAALGYRRGDCPVAEDLASTVLSLPVYPELGTEQLEQVTGAIREFYS